MNCEDYRLKIELPTVGKADLSPFCLDRPVLVVVKENELVFTYFTPNDTTTFVTPVEDKMKDMEPVVIITDKSCLDKVTGEDIIGILTDAESKFTKMEDFIKDVKLAIEIRLDLLKHHKSKLIEVIDTKDEEKINEVAKNYYFILKANVVDISHLMEIINIEDIDSLKEINDLYEDFLLTIIKRVKEDDSLNIKIDK